jgi:hypothetical protein
MRKDYYIRLIPATGTIREGDWYAPNGDLRFLRRRDDPTNAYDYRKCQRYKLYLCYNRVNIGDNFIFFHNGHIIKNLETKIDVETMRFLVKTGAGARVIGQINPKATWVCVGDKFSKDQFTVVDICPNYDDRHLWNDCSCKLGFVDGVVIKKKDV